MLSQKKLAMFGGLIFSDYTSITDFKILILMPWECKAMLLSTKWIVFSSLRFWEWYEYKRCAFALVFLGADFFKR